MNGEDEAGRIAEEMLARLPIRLRWLGGTTSELPPGSELPELRDGQFWIEVTRHNDEHREFREFDEVPF